MTELTRKAKIESLETRRNAAMRQWLADFQSDQTERLRETRALFGEPVVMIDPHTHSEHSDGRATIAMNRDAGIAAGMDIVFATDHGSLTQKRVIHHMPTMSWGQEPGAMHHHIGLLCNTRLFTPRKDRIDLDVARARRLAPFVWIPHPAGWYPRKEYTDEQMESLWSLAPAFAMEVINGAHRIGTAFDRFDEEAVKLWDRLLADGIRVTPLGASDAHIPEGIGCCWTALPGIEKDVESILNGLNSGYCLASEGPLLKISVDGQSMGAAVKVQSKQALTLRYRVADAAGLQSLRIIAGGQERQTLYLRDATLIDDEWVFTPEQECYVRLEARAGDNRRAFSAPIYLEY